MQGALAALQTLGFTPDQVVQVSKSQIIISLPSFKMAPKGVI